jgi:hypothetical protein
MAAIEQQIERTARVSVVIPTLKPLALASGGGGVQSVRHLAVDETTV